MKMMALIRSLVLLASLGAFVADTGLRAGRPQGKFFTPGRSRGNSCSGADRG